MLFYDIDRMMYFSASFAYFHILPKCQLCYVKQVLFSAVFVCLFVCMSLCALKNQRPLIKN